MIPVRLTDAFAGIACGSESSPGREQPFQALVPGHRIAQQSAPGRQDRCLDEITGVHVVDLHADIERGSAHRLQQLCCSARSRVGPR